MRRITLSCFFSLLLFSGFAQDSVLFVSKQRLNLWATQLLFSEVSLGYDFHFSDRKSIEVSAGYGFVPVLITETKLSDIYNPLYENRIVLRLAPKFFLKPNYKRARRTYWGGILVYSHDWYTYKIKKVAIGPNTANYYDQSGNNKVVWFNIVRGIQRNFSQRLLIELYYGGGISYYMSRYTRHSMINPPPPGTTPSFPKEYFDRGFGISVQAGIKISLPLKANCRV